MRVVWCAQMHFLWIRRCTLLAFSSLLEMTILGLTRRKHNAFRLFDQSCDTVSRTPWNPFCILQPNNKRRSSFRPPVSLSLRSVARRKLGNGIANGIKEKERWQRYEEGREGEKLLYIVVFFFSYLFQLVSHLVYLPFVFSVFFTSLILQLR